MHIYIGCIIRTLNAPINHVALAIDFLQLYYIVEASVELSVVRVDMNITNMVCDAQPHLPSQIGAQWGQFTDFVKVINAGLHLPIQFPER